MSGSKKVTVGYKYYLGAHMIFTHGPVDNVTKVWVDNREAWTGTSTGGQITINKPGLFGGQKREGGVSGTIDVEMGAFNQIKNDYLQARLGSVIPAFRGVMGFVLRQVYVGNNPYLKQWRIRATRIQKLTSGATQWYSAKAAIGQNMNPAHIIRECLTDPVWGMGYNETNVDDASFTIAADKLFTEGFGLSILWDKAVELAEFLSTVLQHIDGTLFVDRDTGKFRLKLARDDYVTGDLLLLNESNITRIDNFKRRTTAELTNQVTVIFWDLRTGKDNSITVQDIALAQQQAATIGVTLQYPGITDEGIASKVASRELRALSIPLATCTIYANRQASQLNVGDTFRLTWERFGITQLVMRVASIEFGALDNNLIKIDCAEDVFALGDAIYTAPPSSDWVSPLEEPAACPYHAVYEAPYYELAQRVGDTQASELAVTAGFAMATGTRPSEASFSAGIWTDLGSGYEESETTEFCPSCVLTVAVTSKTSTVWAIGDGIDLSEVVIGTYALIGLEVVRVDAITSTTLTVGRGCLDTVPITHVLNTRIYFVDEFAESTNIEYATGETAQIKLTPITSLGELAVSSAPAQSVTIVARQAKPYPPGRFSINNIYYPETIDDGVDLVVRWVHRDRLTQTASVVDTYAAGIGPEAGTTYTVEVRTAGGVLISQQTGITALIHTFTNAILASNYGNLTVNLWSVRDGITSLRTHTHVINRLAP